MPGVVLQFQINWEDLICCLIMISLYLLVSQIVEKGAIHLSCNTFMDVGGSVIFLNSDNGDGRRGQTW